MALKWQFNTLLFETTRFLHRQLETVFLHTFINVKRNSHLTAVHAVLLCTLYLVHTWTCTTVPVDATAYKIIAKTLIMKIKNWVVNCPGFNSYILEGKNNKKNIWTSSHYLRGWRKGIFNKIWIYTPTMWHIKIVFVPCTKKLFAPLLIPRESPKVNQFWSRGLFTFLKIDCRNANCIKAATVLLVFTFHATIFPCWHSASTTSICCQEAIYPEGGLIEPDLL